MRIAILCTNISYLLNFRRQLIDEIRARRHDVVIIAPDHDASSRKELEKLGVRQEHYRLERSGTTLSAEARVVAELYRIMRSSHLDLLLCIGVKPALYGPLAGRLAGVKSTVSLYTGLGYVYTPSLDVKRRFLQAIVGLITKVSSQFTKRILFQNPDDLSELVKRKIVPSGKAQLVGATGVDLEEWATSPLPSGPVTFVMAARLLKDKGVYEFAEAARLVRQQHPKARFVLLGSQDGSHNAISPDLVARWEDEGLIHSPGHVDVRPWIKASHVFVLPSYYREGVPRSVQEAMSMGRAIITCDTPGCRETVVNGRNGFLVPPRNSNRLALAMRQLIENPALILKMAEESRIIAEKRFDIRTQNRRLLEAIGL